MRTITHVVVSTDSYCTDIADPVLPAGMRYLNFNPGDTVIFNDTVNYGCIDERFDIGEVARIDDSNLVADTEVTCQWNETYSPDINGYECACK